MTQLIELPERLRKKKAFALDPSLTTLQFPLGKKVSLKNLIALLDTSDTVTCISLSGDPEDWKSKSLNALVKCLALTNKVVTKLVVANYGLTMELAAALVKILKSNPRIKTVEFANLMSIGSNDTWKLFCSNMEHFTFAELLLTGADWPSASFRELLIGLKSNRSIKKLICAGNMGRLLEHFADLCQILISHAITDFGYSGSLLADDYGLFKEVLQANHLRKLTLESQSGFNLYFGLISTKLALSLLTDLTIIGYKSIDWDALASAICGIKTLKLLALIDVVVTDEQISLLHLGSNNALTDLSLVPEDFLTYSTLFSDLRSNHTLKKLLIRKSVSCNDSALQKYLTANRSLKEFIIRPNYTDVEKSTFAAIIEALSVNRTLRKISFAISKVDYNLFWQFIEALKANDTLTELDMSKITRISFENRPATHSKDVDDFYLDLLNINKSLRYISGTSEFPFLEEKLKKNREMQHRIIQDTFVIIEMIAKSTHLPLEIWLQIFKYISYPFSSIDFSQRLHNKR